MRTGSFLLGGGSFLAESKLLGFGAFQYPWRLRGRGQDNWRRGGCRGGGGEIGGWIRVWGYQGEGRGGGPGLRNGGGAPPPPHISFPWNFVNFFRGRGWAAP